MLVRDGKDEYMKTSFTVARNRSSMVPGMHGGNDGNEVRFSSLHNKTKKMAVN
jgi:hypothetical protein